MIHVVRAVLDLAVQLFLLHLLFNAERMLDSVLPCCGRNSLALLKRGECQVGVDSAMV
jgi:hypothetical protein